MKKEIAIIFFVVLILNPAYVSADRSQNENLSAAPTRDPRLPPVIPGEKVVTAQGEEIKVWSSSGSVEVSAPNQPMAPGSNNQQLKGIGVIVDQRKELHHQEKRYK